MLHIDPHILHAHEVVSRNSNFLCSLCKKGQESVLKYAFL
jgi:hypothetical protein